MKCRHCNSELSLDFLDLGYAPPSNAYVHQKNLSDRSIYYPLQLKVCEQCWLVQTIDFVNSEEMFNDDYAYFSSTSLSWLEHAKNYVDKVTKRFNLNQNSFVVEIASNDGYLLRNFKDKVPCLGVEPTKSTADASRDIGIEVLEDFFGEEVSKSIKDTYKQADLIIANNVYAHVPDINDFTKGISSLLNQDGVVTIEFPHLLNLIRFNQFDTVYHEHYSYLSLTSVSEIFKKYKLRIFDVEELDTHGGSLRIYGCREEGRFEQVDMVKNLLDEEIKFGLQEEKVYKEFQNRAEKIKDEFLSFLIEKKMEGKKVCGYGAAAKGVTLMNFAGIRRDLLPCIFDAAKSKQNKYIPGAMIPILPPDELQSYQPDYIIIFPWNISEEIVQQLSTIKEHNVSFVTFVPELKEF